MKNVAVGKGSYYHPSKTVSLKFFWEKPNEEIKKVKVKKKKKEREKKNPANNNHCCGANCTEPLSRLFYHL